MLASGLLVGCSTGSTEAQDTPKAHTNAEADAFPVTIDTRSARPQSKRSRRGSPPSGGTDQDNALALGVAPVGATKLTWGGNEEGSSDWFDAELEELA